VLLPYNNFEAVYKDEIIDKYKSAVALLDDKIKSVEMEVKTKKRNNLYSYFNEIATLEGIGDWLTFDRWNVEIGLSITEKKYKEMISEFINKIVEDLNLINTETYAAEILVEYKKTLNASQSITLIRQRKESERIEKERLQAQRTSKRVAELHKISFVFSDIAKAYHFVSNEKISISLKDIETLENNEWIFAYADLEAKAKFEDRAKMFSTAETQPENVAKQPEVLQKPSVETAEQQAAEQQQEEVYEAQFAVKGTLSELNKLKAFLIDNNYQYQNL
jgi:hypothetical protein